MNRCGKCYNWMKKPDCPREKIGIKPNCMEFACEYFILDPWWKKEENK